jgi:hypothetical protein
MSLEVAVTRLRQVDILRAVPSLSSHLAIVIDGNRR